MILKSSLSMASIFPLELALNLITVLLVLLQIAGLWRAFEKAEKPGWAAIIPIYGIIVMLEIIGKPKWHILFILLPFISIFFTLLPFISGLPPSTNILPFYIDSLIAVVSTLYFFYLNIKFAKAYGQTGVGSIIMAILLPFFLYPYLGFSSNIRYINSDEV